MSGDSKILGVVLLARHGDRLGFYQDPLTYTPSQTTITPLGTVQEFQLGQFLRSRYIDTSSPLALPLNPLFNQSQVIVRADAGGEGGVIFDSSIALLQGLFPVSPDNKVTLANGTTVTAPLGGYTYVPIESVEPNNDVSLEGFTSCPALDNKTAAFYASPEFHAVETANAEFLQDLTPFVDGRNVTLINMWNIYDFMNVESIHNATFANRLPPTFLAQAHALANFHEYGVFSDVNPDGIGNIASRTVLPSILTALKRIANASDPLLFHYSAISYKPFLSFFNQTGVVNDGQLPGGIVNYAAALALEVHQVSGASEPVVRFTFKNGTDDATLIPHQMVLPNFAGSGDVPLSTFISALAPDAVNTTRQWCQVCGQTTARGCADLLPPATPPNATLVARADVVPALAAPTQMVTVVELHQPVSPLAAGFIGAFSGLAFAFLCTMILGYFTTKKQDKEAPTAPVASARRNSVDTLTETGERKV